MKVANDLSVSLRKIADPAVAALPAGRCTCHSESAECLALCKTVLPSFVTCTLSVVNVATQLLLHSSNMLVREVPSLSSRKICAVSVASRCGSERSPDLDEVMISPLGSDTLMDLLLRMFDSVCASDSRSSM